MRHSTLRHFFSPPFLMARARIYILYMVCLRPRTGSKCPGGEWCDSWLTEMPPCDKKSTGEGAPARSSCMRLAPNDQVIYFAPAIKVFVIAPSHCQPTAAFWGENEYNLVYIWTKLSWFYLHQDYLYSFLPKKTIGVNNKMWGDCWKNCHKVCLLR
jgi:hypothetical protein